MTDSSLIATLHADGLGYASDAFRLPHNQHRYFPPSSSSGTHCIHLRLDQPVKHRGRITFGCDPATCDILLVQSGLFQGSGLVSKVHFFLAFDAKKRLFLQDVSTNGTMVVYDDKTGDQQTRSHFRWTLFEHIKAIDVKLKLASGAWLRFRLVVSEHDKDRKEFEDCISAFNKTMTDTLPSLEHLVFNSSKTSLAPSEILSPKHRPIYVHGVVLGNGMNGFVRKTIDVSTGNPYASKEFYDDNIGANESKILRTLRHENIIQFVDTCIDSDGDRFLIMEYARFGNLEEQNKLSPLFTLEALEILFQGLNALEYLHSQEVTHRNIKPANILVCSRSPLRIKLADFGIAKTGPKLYSVCGAPLYMAPEIWGGGEYTCTVDIWSLGVVVTQYAYGLPKPKGNRFPPKAAWCDYMVDEISQWEPDKLTAFILEHMLQKQPQQRSSAEKCLKEGSQICINDGEFRETGSLTPKVHEFEDSQKRRTINLSGHPTNSQHTHSNGVDLTDDSQRSDIGKRKRMENSSSAKRARITQPE